MTLLLCELTLEVFVVMVTVITVVAIVEFLELSNELVTLILTCEYLNGSPQYLFDLLMSDVLYIML